VALLCGANGLGLGHYPTGKGLEKSLEKASRKSLEKSLRWKTSFKASKSFKK
jgi:hypothetical protein